MGSEQLVSSFILRLAVGGMREGKKGPAWPCFARSIVDAWNSQLVSCGFIRKSHALLLDPGFLLPREVQLLL